MDSYIILEIMFWVGLVVIAVICIGSALDEGRW